MKNIPVSLHRRKLLPAIPVLLYFINLQYVYRNIFIKNKFLQGAVLFFSKYIFAKRRTEDLGGALKTYRASFALLFVFGRPSLRKLSVSTDDSNTLLKKNKKESLSKKRNSSLNLFLLWGTIRKIFSK